MATVSSTSSSPVLSALSTAQSSSDFGLGLSGLASGFDWHSLVDQLTQAEQVPETLLQQQQVKLQTQNNAYGSLVTEFGVLKNAVDALNATSLFSSRVANVSDPTVATATAASGALAGAYTFNIANPATAAVQFGSDGIGAALSATNDVSGLVLGNATFATPITAGTLTVSGSTITIATTDTLQQVFDRIHTATGNAVTASYDSSTDKITLSSASPIILGSSGDTSNFLQVTRLANNGTGTIHSTAGLGSVSQTTALSSANFATAISDGGSGTGAFTVNGVTINFNASTDALGAIIARINSSAASVTANYDAINDRLTLTNNNTGDLGVGLQDVTGNFLAATGLSTGTLQRGANLLYTVNGGGQLSSQSNTITAASSGITGLSVTALKGGITTVQVASDTATIQTAITNFVAEYNKVQSLIDSQTASTTAATGVVTAGPLTGDYSIESTASQLRSAVYSSISGLNGAIKSLSQLGYQTNGNDNTLALSDSSVLTNALTTNLNGVRDFFSNATNGLAATLSSYIDGLANSTTGSLVSHQSVLTKNSTGITTQIAAMESRVQLDRQRMIDEFTAMETAQGQINQQLQYLAQAKFGS